MTGALLIADNIKCRQRVRFPSPSLTAAGIVKQVDTPDLDSGGPSPQAQTARVGASPAAFLGECVYHSATRSGAGGSDHNGFSLLCKASLVLMGCEALLSVAPPERSGGAMSSAKIHPEDVDFTRLSYESAALKLFTGFLPVTRTLLSFRMSNIVRVLRGLLWRRSILSTIEIASRGFTVLAVGSGASMGAWSAAMAVASASSWPSKRWYRAINRSICSIS